VIAIRPFHVSVNPATEREIERFAIMDAPTIEHRLAGVLNAAAKLRSIGAQRRSQMLRDLAKALRSEADRFARIITAEMGRPLAEARVELLKSAECCEYYAETGPKELADEPTESDSTASRVVFDPLGPVLLIAPWNLPVWQVLRFVIPAVAAGNPVVLKHAPNVSRCALELEALFLGSEFPAGTLTTLIVDIPQTEQIIADPRVRLIAFTGSTVTGARVAALAGASVKKCLLELGGSDAFIVLEDADVAEAARAGARSRFLNAGQTCLAAKRFLIADDIAEEFSEAVTALADKIVVGDPTASVDMGPLAREDLREKVEMQVQSALAGGARLLTGGNRPFERGYFYRPTVLAECQPDMGVFREETFGPVLPIMRVRDIDHALHIANQSIYGLSAAVWTNDDAIAEYAASRLETGGVFVNGMTHSDPRIPFGGIKASGYGRDLGRFILNDLCNIKTLWKSQPA
jgi:succinate-semialdehyde dehydrogenase/glutarate-semialdehyde dehydrogenase